MSNSNYKGTPFYRRGYRRKRVAFAYWWKNAATPQKLEFLQNKYGLSSEDLPLLEKADPTKKGAYLDWIAKQFSRGKLRFPEDIVIIKNNLELFDKFKKKGFFTEPKDINQYQTPGALYEALENYKDLYEVPTKQLKREHSEGAEAIIRTPEYTWYEVTTPEAANKLGSGTSWCTVPDPDVAEDYLKEGPLYILYMDGKPKAQIHIPSEQAMDKHDMEIGEFRYGHFVYYQPKKLEWPSPDIIRALFQKIGGPQVVIEGADDWDKSVILKDPQTAADYAAEELEARWPEAEPLIMKNPEAAFIYARWVLKHRWPEAEPYIINNPQVASRYANWFLNGRWREAEPLIMEDPMAAYTYAADVLKGRWPEAEPYIIKSPLFAAKYAIDVLKGRWPEAEETILKNPFAVVQYTYGAMHERWPEGEKRVKGSPFEEDYETLMGVKLSSLQRKSYVTNPLIWFKNYLEMSDEGRKEDLIYTYGYDYEDFLAENDYEDPVFSEEYSNDIWSYFEAPNRNKELIDEFGDYLLDNFDLLADRDPADAPSWRYMDFRRVVKNQWLIHFTDNAEAIADEGFQFGLEDYTKLGLTTHIRQEAKKAYDPFYTYVFAYDLSNLRYARGGAGHFRGEYKYGSEAVMFRASGIEVWHYGDEEPQVIFTASSAKNFVPILNDYGDWSVYNERTGEVIYSSEYLENVVEWVLENYEQYRRVL